MVKIAVLADTHDLLRPEIPGLLQGCEAILHAGDVSSPPVLEALERLAPVHAVRGNNDGAWAEHLPQTLDFTLGGLRVLMTHKKKDLPEDLSGWDLVVCGHSHRYSETRTGRTLLLNPGSCGPRRFRQPITLALVTADAQGLRAERVEIPHAADLAEASPSPGDMRRIVAGVMRETARGRSPAEIAKRAGIDPALAEQIARLYVTHPGVTEDGILAKMGL